MAMNLDALLRIKADVQGENNIRRLGNSLQGLQGQTKNVAQGFASLRATVVGVAAAIGSSALVAVVKQGIDAGNALFNLQAKTGIAANALIGIGNAAKLADVEIGTVQKGLTRLSVNLVKAAEGNQDLGRAFASLGVRIKDANGQVVPADQALKQIANRFADMPDGAGKAAAAVSIFGKAGAELIPMLNEGAGSMEKFTYKVSEDFAARSDLFGDTLAEFGIQVQGFTMELTSALLPALQTILVEFGKLFSTKQDWTALFDVIKVGLRSVATFLYATIKLVDQWVKVIVVAFDAVGKAIQGDFIGAGQAIAKGISTGVEQATADFAALGRLWKDAPSPGTGLRTGGTAMALDTSAIDERLRREQDKARRAAEQRQNQIEGLTNQILDFQRQLTQSTQDTQAVLDATGVSATQAIKEKLTSALVGAQRDADDLIDKLIDLDRSAAKLGLELTNRKVFRQMIDDYRNLREQAAFKQQDEDLKNLLPSLESYNTQISEAKLLLKNKVSSIDQLTESQKLEIQIEQQSLQVLAQQNPALREHIDLLRQRAKELDDLQSKLAGTNSFQDQFREKLKEYYKSVSDFGSAVGNVAVNAFQGLEDKLTELVTTGKASFAELTRSILADLARIALRAAIIKPILGVVSNMFPNLFKFADGGIMTASGSLPLRQYASGGIANSPQLAMFGEGSQPEAYVPLPDGRRIPVAMKGGGAGGTAVTVNVDARGTSVQGDDTRGNQLGRVITAAVQAELIKQRRPGGLLAA